MGKKTWVFKKATEIPFKHQTAYLNAIQKYLFKNNVNVFLRNVLNDLYKGEGCVIAIVGKPGKGKSTFAYRIAKAITWYMHHMNWDFEKNRFYNIYDFADRVQTARNEVLIKEEAEDDLNSDEWWSPENKYFSRTIMTQRILNNCYIIILPYMKELSPRQRRHISYMCSVRSRRTIIIRKIIVDETAIFGNEFHRPILCTLTPKLPDDKTDYNKYLEDDQKNKDKIRFDQRAELYAARDKGHKNPFKKSAW